MAKKLIQTYHEAIGRRKSAIARVRLYTGKEVTFPNGAKVKSGQILINGKHIHEFFPAKADKVRYLQPLKLVESEEKYAVSIQVSGGGRNGQVDAVILGLARALEKINPEHRTSLKKAGFLTRNPRIKERRKVGTGGKARRQKQSPKR